MGEALKIGITGLPGAGKTYCLLKVIEMQRLVRSRGVGRRIRRVFL